MADIFHFRSRRAQIIKKRGKANIQSWMFPDRHPFIVHWEVIKIRFIGGFVIDMTVAEELRTEPLLINRITILVSGAI